MKQDPVEHCRIGQKDRCGSTGCEWKKVFNRVCEKREPIAYVPVHNMAIGVKQKKEVEVVKPEPKKTVQFKVASQDDWIKRIKVK